jgi:hypothetical protein
MELASSAGRGALVQLRKSTEERALSGANLSRPQYSSLIPDALGTINLVVAEGEGGTAVIELLQKVTKEFAERCNIIYVPVLSTNNVLTTQLSGIEEVSIQICASLTDLLSALHKALEASTMSMRLYVSGSESFIGRVTIMAHQFGVSHTSIQTEHRGSLARKVQCVHCKWITEDVATNIVQCAKCDVLLFVRDHYSHRLGAFMGVSANAEEPDAAIIVTEIFP